MSSIDTQCWLITGASQGIGQYLSVYIAHRGGRVIGVARSEAGLAETARQVADSGGEFIPIVGDLRDGALPDRVLYEISQHGGVLDVLVHNAADVTSKPFRDTTPAEIDSLVETNVTAPLRLTRALLPALEASNSASIVFMSSLAGYKPNPTQTVYSTTKSAVNGMADALRAELGPSGVHILCAALPSVGTAECTKPGQVPVAVFAQRLESAISGRQNELFFSPVSKWLMRFYRALPFLMNPRTANK